MVQGSGADRRGGLFSSIWGSEREGKTDIRSERLPWTSWLLLVVVFLLIAVGSRALAGSIMGYPARFAATALFGLLVGTAELVSRYRDKPTAPLTTLPGFIYITTNALASVGALWLLLRNGVTYDFGGVLPPDLAQVLLAGFGTMILFRSSLLTVRVGDTDVSIGPAAVLQIILNASDRACDRLRAGPRSERVKNIMRGVSFKKAQVALPLHCFALMQNVSTAEQTQVTQLIKSIADATLTDDIKAYNLGLVMMNVVGEEVLDKAVKVLGPLVLVPADDDPPILTNVSTLTTDDVMAVADICVALDPQARKDRTGNQLRDDIETTTAKINPTSVRNIVILMQLRERFGPTTVARALALLQSGRQPVGKTSTEQLTAADLLTPTPSTAAGGSGGSGGAATGGAARGGGAGGTGGAGADGTDSDGESRA